MANAIHLLSTDALQDLKTALGRFADEAEQALHAADVEIERVVLWLEERRRYWEGQVADREVELSRAERQLATCLRSGDEDAGPPDCRDEEWAVCECQARLDEALTECDTVASWSRHLAEATESYRREADRLRLVLSTDAVGATRFLNAELDLAQAFLAERGPSSLVTGSPSSGAATPRLPTGTTATDHVRALERRLTQVKRETRIKDALARRALLQSEAVARAEAALAKSARPPADRLAPATLGTAHLHPERAHESPGDR